MKTISFFFGLLMLTTFSTNNVETSNTNNVEPDSAIACRLKLKRIKCIVPEGYASLDAIYMKIIADGSSKGTWPDNRLRMGTGDYVDLEGKFMQEFNSEVELELWDDDTWDSDDFLGSVTIDCRYDSDGVARFTGDGADYKIYYSVN